MVAILQPQARLPTPRISMASLRLFAFYNKQYLRRHFHRIRILKEGLPRILNQPTVIFLNHAAWWDPLVCLLLARRFFPDRDSFAPIDSDMLDRYRFFQRLGFFGVEQRSLFGAATFLQISRALLASSQNILWITPQGRFMDVRERPLNFQRGLAKLAGWLPDVAFLPLAVEYSFWTETKPEILVSFGPPVISGKRLECDPAGWNQLLPRCLENLQDELAMASCRRNSEEWLTLDQGRRGGNRIYDAIRSLRSWLRRHRYQPDHHFEVDQ
jgi:1-acyl-sn-glycerol-3-phosphate acyltransferase